MLIRVFLKGWCFWGDYYSLVICVVAFSNCFICRLVVTSNDEASIRYLLDRGADARLGPPLRETGGSPWSICAEANSYHVLNAAAAYCMPDILHFSSIMAQM
ncbi:hypothetical protein FB567DRAFT_540868 [Paraphoma chrysanthemicola]|uniref:Uncharacterized protein n=1 Tax=Paraphoma chrysanthemicola TaxID=798071 RepID=A0A8K0QSI8_9PLEO|nr:hypothetical protein FB567DRAFT_540868 [Paraphoma chrysanthemicola]